LTLEGIGVVVWLWRGGRFKNLPTALVHNYKLHAAVRKKKKEKKVAGLN
jgi:hypothetical protein